MKGKTTFAYAMSGVLAVSAAVLVQGCYEPPEKQEMSADHAFSLMAAKIRVLMGGFSDDMRVLEDFPLMQKLYKLTNGGTSCSAEMLYDPVSGDPIGFGDEVCRYEPGEDDLSFAFDEVGENAINLMHDYVFVPSQIESEGFGAMILLKPDVFCGIFSNGAAGQGDIGVEESDEYQFCHDLLTAVPVRLDIYSYWTDTVNVDVLVGDSRTFTLGIQLWGEGIYIDADLAYLVEALKIVNNLFQFDGDPLFDSLEATGRVSAYLSRDWNGVHYLHGEIYDRAEIAMDRPEGQYGAEADYSIFYIWANDETNEFQVVVAAQDFEVSFPYQLFADVWNQSSEAPVDVDGTMRLHSDGLNFIADGKPNEGTLTVQQFGLGSGPMTVARGFDTLFGLELNPAAGQNFDLVLSLDDDGHVKAAVTDVFDLAIDWNLGLVASDLDEVPAGMSDETWRILLNGTAPGFTVLDGLNDEWLKITSGTLTVSSTGAPEGTVQASAGQCVTATGDETHPLLSVIKSSECIAAE